jgi:predicted aspartyl protease/Flp pilus assembly protein TadD
VNDTPGNIARRALARWLGTGVLALAGLQLHAAVQAKCELKVTELPVKMVGVRAIATVGINGSRVPLIVDSGAYTSILTEAAAAQLKLSLHPMPNNGSFKGVDGRVDGYATTIDKLELLGASLPDVQFIVGGIEPGAGSMGIIGRDILSIADTEYDLANGAIRFVFPSDDCGNANMAYWAGKTPVSEIALVRDNDNPALLPEVRGIVRINDKPMLATLDSGASASSLKLAAARELGLADSDMKAVGMSYGAAGKGNKSWSAPFAKIDIGGEVIRNSRLYVTDDDLHEDMLLGMDFFLSHRIYVSKKRRLMFFTYNGGRIFEENVAAPATAAASATPSGDDPTLDADAYSRRGAASAARGDFTGALADLDRACAMAPATAALFAQRAAIQQALQRPAKANQDIDKALELDPHQVDARMQRATARAREKDTQGALTDLAELDKTLAPEATMRVQMGRLYLGLYAPAQAVVQFDLWVPHHPHEFRLESVLYDRCIARVELGVDLDKAFDDCNAAVDADSKSGVYLAGRAWARLRQGTPSNARADFDRSLALRPDHALTLYGRGLARQRLGDATAGKADLDAARKLDPKIDAEMKRLGLDRMSTATH